MYDHPTRIIGSAVHPATAHLVAAAGQPTTIQVVKTRKCLGRVQVRGRGREVVKTLF